MDPKSFWNEINKLKNVGNIPCVMCIDADGVGGCRVTVLLIISVQYASPAT